VDGLQKFLRHLLLIRSSGEAVDETSYYPAFAGLFEDIGAHLSPKVRPVFTLRNRGEGMPDGGLFTPDQLHSDDGVQGQPPSRGAIEIKPPSVDLTKLAQLQQVQRYVRGYGQVLVSNFRGFGVVDSTGLGESISLADNEVDFWRLVRVGFPNRDALRVSEFLTRAFLRPAPLHEPRDVAFVLASYAKDARARIQSVELPALQALREALESTLGIGFRDEEGDRFFRSTLVQTLFYGVFAAWVLWRHDSSSTKEQRFNWREASWTLHVPMIRSLYDQIATPAHLQPLGLVEVLDWAAGALNRVQPEFFAEFAERDAVQYFYEPFLEAFDPELRKQLGVWYTPHEVVDYMVARVDEVLRTGLGIADGVASDDVLFLDPCCGTGAFLVGIVEAIARRRRQSDPDSLVESDIKDAVLTRIFGFELLPAPFVVAHLQLGLFLQRLGVPLQATERVPIYLSNALTGWSSDGQAANVPLFPELREERDAADSVKRGKKILVVLGNPPYNGYAGVAMSEERGLVAPYRETTRTARPEGQGLNDLYVRFFRAAERRIVERSGEGIVSFISNYSWLDGSSFTGMRERYLEAFDEIWIDSLHGDKFRTGKQTPQGEPDPSVFSTELNREGIQVGTAVALLLRRPIHNSSNKVSYREFWGVTKRSDLLYAINDPSKHPYVTFQPEAPLGLRFTPGHVCAQYIQWPTLPELFPTYYPGVQTKRDDLVVAFDELSLRDRIGRYFDSDVSDADIAKLSARAMQQTNRFDPHKVRQQLLLRGVLRDHFVRYCYRPFDVRWVYWEPETKLLGEKVPSSFRQLDEANLFLVTTGRTRKYDVVPPLVTRWLTDLNAMDSGASVFPLRVRVFDTSWADNISDVGRRFVEHVGATTRDLFAHCVAILHSAKYRNENTDAIRYDWPRIPLPTKNAFERSALLGESVIHLLDETIAHQPHAGIGVAVLSRVGGSAAVQPHELVLTAGWGYENRAGAIMPGRGRLRERPFSTKEILDLDSIAASLSLTREAIVTLLGEGTVDIFLNENIAWLNVPAAVWAYTLGGYAVLKKWLSYRETSLLKRPLSKAEARYFSDVTRRLTWLVLQEPLLHSNYEAAVSAALDPKEFAR